MRLSIQRLEQGFQPIQRRAGQANGLTAAVDQVNAFQPKRADDDDVAIIIVAVWRGPAGQARVGGLHEDDLVGGGAGQQDAPLLDQRAGTDDRKNLAFAITVAAAVTLCRSGASQYVSSTDAL